MEKVVIKCRIPANLNIDDLLLKVDWGQIKGFNREKLTHFLALLTDVPAFNAKVREQRQIDGYVPLYSQILASIAKEYAAYFKSLEDAGILEINHSYQAEDSSSGVWEGKSKGYKYTTTYSGTGYKWAVYVQKSDKEFSSTASSDDAHLRQWFNRENLNIDTTLVERNADFLYSSGEISEEQKEHCIINANRMDQGIYHFHVDRKTGRLHTNCSNLRKESRNAVSYNGSNGMVSVDIRNSQPFLSTVLLNPEFWSESSSSLNISCLQPYTYKQVKRSPQLVEDIVMYSKKSIHRGDLSLYVDRVVGGLFYEFLIDHFINAGFGSVTRDDAKKLVMQILFSHNQHMEGVKYRVFEDLFPTVYGLFRLIKRDQHNTLALLLQNIESYLVLHKCCKKMDAEQPGVPCFTIHDSIMTTPEHGLYVSDIMRAEILNGVGYSPKLHFENYRSEKLKISQPVQYTSSIA